MRNILKIELNPDRIFGLDILRALAILFVVIEHGRFLLPKNLSFISKFFTFDGVSIFFVLSGFLIGGILIKILEKNKIDLKVLFNFWIRRWFRTLPNYFLILLILTILHLCFINNFTLWSIKGYFIFSQNLVTEHPSWFFPEAWSLSVEEWFYLLIPILIFSFIKILKITPRTSILLTSLLIISSVTMFRFIRYENVHVENVKQWDLLFRKEVFTRLDSLMYGVIGAYISFYHKKEWLRYKNILILTGVLLFILSNLIVPKIFLISGLYYCVFSFSLISLATLFLLPYLSNLKTGNGVIYKYVTYTSLISYSMYLLNLSIVRMWIINKINWAEIISDSYLISIINYIFYWFLTIILSILLYKYFEIPLTRLRDK